MEDELAEDLAALWRSELAAMLADREVSENWVALCTLWRDVAAAALPRAGDGSAPGGADAGARPPGDAGADEPARAEAAAAASDPGLAEVGRLEWRIAELERRLAAFERNRGEAG